MHTKVKLNLFDIFSNKTKFEQERKQSILENGKSEEYHSSHFQITAAKND